MPPPQTTDPDPHRWLEEVDSDRALTWVHEHSGQAEDVLTAHPRYAQLHAGIQEALEAPDRIPLVAQAGDHLYGFWTDADHPRGVWRRTTWDSYRTDEPDWEVLVDLDALTEAEDVPWVWQGAGLLRPDLDRALVHLSRGGADANVARELDLTTGEWVAGPEAFTKPEAKGRLVWRDRDHVYLTTADDPTGMTRSGYPRTLRLWRRGTPMDQAEVVHTIPEEDLGLFVSHDQRTGRTVLHRALAFYRQQTLVVDDGRVRALDLPESADASVHGEHVALRLRHPWQPSPDGPEQPAGSLLVAPLAAVLEDPSSAGWTALFTPDDRSALVDLTWTRDQLVTTVLVDVRHTVHVHRPRPDGEGWESRDLTELLDVGLRTVSVSAVDDHESDDLWLVTTGYLDPMTLSVARVGGGTAVGDRVELDTLKAAPERFDATGLEVVQRWATSADGTRVPYWQVGPAGLPLDGTTPTVLHGYGGFEQALTPAYDPIVGRSWLAHGHVHVVAGIRGGGEFGPRWHQAALQEHRHRAYEDFVAVARDLVARGVTSVEHLGCTGRSNGGLLVGNMITGYPEDFGAIVCQVPLLDMGRYHHLLAGASWMAEYGDPDAPGQWDFLQTFSPYQLLAGMPSDRTTPPVYLATSTRDDRVHPGHARKMAARLAEQGRDVTYWENTEGGHGGASTPEQWATWHALAWAFLHGRLAGQPPGPRPAGGAGR